MTICSKCLHEKVCAVKLYKDIDKCDRFDDKSEQAKQIAELEKALEELYTQIALLSDENYTLKEKNDALICENYILQGKLEGLQLGFDKIAKG